MYTQRGIRIKPTTKPIKKVFTGLSLNAEPRSIHRTLLKNSRKERESNIGKRETPLIWERRLVEMRLRSAFSDGLRENRRLLLHAIRRRGNLRPRRVIRNRL